MGRGFGSGSVTRRVRRNGREQYWARGPQVNGRRVSLGYFDTYEEAARVAGISAEELAKDRIEASKEPTFLAYANATWFPRIELHLPQSHGTYVRRFRRVAKAEWTRLALSSITRKDIKQWVEMRMRSGATKRVTIKADLALVRSVFAHAIDDELLELNPATSIKVPRDTREAFAPHGATVEEQRALLGADLPIEDRLPIAVVMLTGLRRWEFLALQLTDIHWDTSRLRVQRGVKGGPTKSKKPRWVPLIPPAHAALRIWVDEVLPRYCPRNPRGLVFPGRHGGYRDGWFRNVWQPLRKRLGLGMRFHDLRHTTGTSLVNGDWGRKWSLDEVREILGHASVTQTEQYARTSLGQIDSAAACTTGEMVHGLLSSGKSSVSRVVTCDPGVPAIISRSPEIKANHALSGTRNGGACTTWGGVVDVAALLDEYAVDVGMTGASAAALALAAMRCA